MNRRKNANYDRFTDSKYMIPNKPKKSNDKTYVKEDGTVYEGEVHEMPDGSLHSGASHTSESVVVVPLIDRVKLLSESIDMLLDDSIYTNPSLRNRIKDRIMAGNRGGKRGQWSARKSQLLVREYEKAGGGYKKGKRKGKSQKSLERWTKQDWRTKSGKPSTQGKEATGERYLPRKVIERMSSQAYSATSRKKREDLKKGKQFSKQTPKAKEVARNFRKK
tara:strand:- start:2147 stop:2806 length:660 start_codon:yes stop_codon:yes gene_type:complete